MNMAQKIQKFYDNIDFDKIYYCNMVDKQSQEETVQPVRIIACEDKISYKLIPLSDKFEEKYFYDGYVEWLFYTKYISEEKELNKNYKIVE